VSSLVKVGQPQLMLRKPPESKARKRYGSYKIRIIMKIAKTPFHRIRLITGIVLCIIMTSCNGQANNDDKQSVIKQTIQLPNFNNQISDVVRTIFQDSKGNIWFGAQGGAFKLTGDSLIHIDSIRSESGGRVTIKDIAEDKDGIIWFGHTDGISSIDGTTVTNYYESDGLISNDVWCIETDVNGNVWIGTIAGACIFDGLGFNNFDLPEGKIDTTVGVSSTKMIHSILEDSKGTIWFCTNAGIFSYSNKNLKNISDEVGVPTNFVSKIVEDKKGGFWVSTSKGLFYLKENVLTNISELHFEESKGTGSLIVDAKVIFGLIALVVYTD
jgi:ligand-binding sensor domain-containing protein